MLMVWMTERRPNLLITSAPVLTNVYTVSRSMLSEAAHSLIDTHARPSNSLRSSSMRSLVDSLGVRLGC